MGAPIPTHAEMRDCAKCSRASRHEPDREGVYSCVDCKARESRVGNRAEGRVLLWVAIGIFGTAILYFVLKQAM